MVSRFHHVMFSSTFAQFTLGTIEAICLNIGDVLFLTMNSTVSGKFIRRLNASFIRMTYLGRAAEGKRYTEGKKMNPANNYKFE